MPAISPILENIGSIEEQLAAACQRAGRSRSDVKLMAVSKTQPVEAIAEAFAAGLRLFGENRVQEFQQKSAALKTLGIDTMKGVLSAQDAAQVHLIGHLQSNKTSRAAEIFSAIDTLDSLKLAQRLHEAAAGLNQRLPVLIEMKLSTEEAKTGLVPDSPELAELLEQIRDLSHLHLKGLMTVAPLDENPETARACFRQLFQLRNRLTTQYPQLDFSELSMGMSGDFQIAIEEGSTQVRIGTAIFGARPKPA
jgi:PLP dependent protein